MNTSRIAMIACALGAIAGLSTAASAETRWGRHHPRQHEVLKRAHHQIARINHERREGEITGAQARADRATDRAIMRQDHADARANGGYITRAEQRQLNAEENAQSRTIGK
ncbi:hypothetical protein [uncultured Sphingomonas sp.]|uniref:hypothetical protein n=1 Tax=uncultured Sphingomonas sp. TaxID=158754 RepID=UPI002634A3CC|nr:hypothetical protein [uncultured Sphingomonas sp.]